MDASPPNSRERDDRRQLTRPARRRYPRDGHETGKEWAKSYIESPFSLLKMYIELYGIDYLITFKGNDLIVDGTINPSHWHEAQVFWRDAINDMYPELPGFVPTAEFRRGFVHGALEVWGKVVGPLSEIEIE